MLNADKTTFLLFSLSVSAFCAQGKKGPGHHRLQAGVEIRPRSSAAHHLLNDVDELVHAVPMSITPLLVAVGGALAACATARTTLSRPAVTHLIHHYRHKKHSKTTDTKCNLNKCHTELPMV